MSFQTLQVQLHNPTFCIIHSKNFTLFTILFLRFFTVPLQNLQLQLHNSHFTTANYILQLHVKICPGAYLLTVLEWGVLLPLGSFDVERSRRKEESRSKPNQEPCQVEDMGKRHTVRHPVRIAQARRARVEERRTVLRPDLTQLPVERRRHVKSEGVWLCAATVRHIGLTRTGRKVRYRPEHGSEGQDADAAGHEEWLVSTTTAETNEDDGDDEAYRLGSFD